MNNNSTLFKLLSSQEAKLFIHFLTRRNKRLDTNNIALFKSVLKGKEEQIRNSMSTNAYNVMYMRLKNALLDFMANNIMESELTEEVQLIKQIVLARKLFTQKQLKLAFSILHKVEKQAKSINHYSILNEVYHTLIEYSHLDISEDQLLLFQKMEVNSKAFIAQERLNMVYAEIRLAFKNEKDIDLKQILEEGYLKYNIPKNTAHNFKTLYQLAMIADITGTNSKDFHSIDLFFMDEVNEIAGGKLDSEAHLIYHIDLLYSIANIFFRKKEFKKSLAYLKRMLEQMNRSGGRYFDSRIMNYSTLVALNENFSGNYSVAEDVLDNVMLNRNIIKEELGLPILTRTMIHFQQGELKQAKKQLSLLNHSESWYEKKNGLEWVLNKRFIEILLHIEFSDVDYVESRINSLIKKYGAYLKNNPDTQVISFLKLVKRFFNEPELVRSNEFKILVEDSISWKKYEQEDVFLMSYYAWLKSKMENRNVYAVTLEIINKVEV